MDKKIVAFRLVTGEFVIANLEEELSSKYRLRDPLIFQIYPVEKERTYQTAFSPLIPLGKPGQEVILQDRDIMFWITEIDDQLVSTYNQVTSTIVVPTGGKKWI